MNTPATTKPARVGLAVNLLYAGIALSVVAFIVGFAKASSAPQDSSSAIIAGVIGGGILSIAIALWFTIMIAKGKNWARVIFLVLLVIGVVLDLTQLGHLFSFNPINGVLNIIETLLQLAAAWLLFTGESPAWFTGSSGQ